MKLAAYAFSAACFVGGGVCGHVAFDRCVRLTRVEGPSMEPVLQPNDRILGVTPDAWCAFQRLRSLVTNRGNDDEKRRCWEGRIVVLDAAPGTLYCKVARVPEAQARPEAPLTHITALGVNAAQSLDSRSFGDMPLAAVTSVALCKVWPRFVWFGAVGAAP
jgi:hypothetical protein